MDEATRKIPSHEVTYGRLRDMILFGRLQPGQPVTIQGLVRELDAGMTPVREAIRRMTAEGALLPQGNRRVAVPELTPALLDQLAFVRLTVEPKLAEMDGKLPPPELLKGYRAAFINPNSKLLGPKFKFARHGQSGAELSELLPHTAKMADDLTIVRSMKTDAFMP